MCVLYIMKNCSGGYDTYVQVLTRHFTCQNVNTQALGICERTSEVKKDLIKIVSSTSYSFEKFFSVPVKYTLL